MHVAVPQAHGVLVATALPSVVEQGSAHWLLLLVHVWPLVHVAVPHVHGVVMAIVLPSVAEQFAEQGFVAADSGA